MEHPLKRLKFAVALFIVIVSMIYADAHASLVNLRSIDEGEKLDGIISIFEDKDREYSIAELATKEGDKLFKKNESANVNFGYSSSAFWTKFSIAPYKGDPDDRFILEISYPHLDEVYFYEEAEGDTFYQEISGANFPLSSRTMKNRKMLFTLHPSESKTNTYYLRFVNRGSLKFPMKIFSYNGFLAAEQNDRIVYGLFFGFLIALFLYIAALAFSFREVEYYVFLIFLFCIGGFYFIYDGFGFEYVWGEAPQVNLRMRLLGISGLIMGITAFARYFFRLWNWSTVLDRLFIGLFVGELIAFVLSAFMPVEVMIPPTSVLPMVLILFLIIEVVYLSVKRHPLSAIANVAWGLAIFGGLAFGLGRLGVIPNSLVSFHGLKFSMGLTSLVFAIGLSRRVNAMKELLQQQKNELSKYSLELEEKVRMRTAEMEMARRHAEEQSRQKTHFLADMSHELRTPLNSINGIADLLRFGSYENAEEVSVELNAIIEILKTSRDKVEKETADEIDGIIKHMKELFDFLQEDGNMKRYVFNDMYNSFQRRSLYDNDGLIEERKQIAKHAKKIEHYVSKEEEETFKAYRHIKDAGDYLLALINSVLDISKVESGKIELEKSSVNLRGLISSVMVNANNYCKSKKKDRLLSLSSEVHEDIPKTVIMDSQRIMQVLLNLLSNSIKFSNKGTVLLRVSLREDDNRQELLFEVSDEGRGIKVEERPKIFTEFGRSESSKDVDGTGLGLALSKRLVRMHGGEIDFESEFGKGTRFFFYIPVNAQEQHSAPEN